MSHHILVDMNKLFKIALCIVLVPFGLVLALVLMLTAYVVMRSGDIAPIDDSDLQIEEQVVADEDNMIVALLSVTNLHTVSQKDGLLCSTYRNYRWNGRGLPSRDYPDMQVVTSTIDRVLADNAAYFEGLHAAVSRSSYKVTERDVLIFPPISALMQGANLLRLKALREVERNEYEAALLTLRDLSAFARLERENPCGMLDLIIGLGIEGFALRSSQELACAEAVPDEILADLSEMLKEDLDPKALFDLALRREYNNNLVPAIKYMSDVANRGTFGGFIHCGDLEEGTSILSPLTRVQVIWHYLYKPETTRRECAEWVRCLKEDVSWQPVAGKPNFFTPNLLGRCLLEVICPEGEGCFKAIKKAQTERALSRLTVAAQRYRRAHDGDCPPNLDALVPAFIASVPEDPFAPGHPLNYDAKTLYAWSVGPEGSFNPRPERKIHDLGRHRYNLLDWSVRLDGKIQDEEFRKKEPRSGMR